MDLKRLTKAELIQKINAQNITMSGLSKTIEIRDSEIAHLRSITKQIEEKQEKINKQNLTISGLSKTIEMRDSEIKELESKVNSTNFSNEEKLKLEKRIAQLESELHSVRSMQELEQLRESNAKVAEMYKKKVDELNATFSMFKDLHRILDGALHMSIDSLALLEEKIIRGD